MPTETAETIENTPAKWESVISELAARQQAAREHIEQLQKTKQDLALEAAMGGPDARKKLDKANTELARLTTESDDWDAAIAQARSRLANARDAEANAAENARQAELRTLAEIALMSAKDFSAALQQAASAGAALKTTVRSMLSIATPGERKNIDRLLEYGPYMRDAEFAGLRSHLEFQGYTGLREHIVPLADALKVHIGTWLPELTTNGTEK